jgi:hypothetical protein
MKRGDYIIRGAPPMKGVNMMFFVAFRNSRMGPANLAHKNAIRGIEVIPDVLCESRGQCGQTRIG